MNLVAIAEEQTITIIMSPQYICKRSSVQTIQLVMPWMVFRFMGSLMQMEKNQKTLINSTEEQKKMGIVIIQQKLTLMLTVVYAEKSRFEMAKLIPNPEQILLGLMADR